MISVDTRPLFRPSAKSPGGRPQYDYGNAETFLEISEALAQAVIGQTTKELRKESNRKTPAHIPCCKVGHESADNFRK